MIGGDRHYADQSDCSDDNQQNYSDNSDSLNEVEINTNPDNDLIVNSHGKDIEMPGQGDHLMATNSTPQV